MSSTFTTTPADDRATEFKPAIETGEQYSGYRLMVEAYAGLWVVLLVWFFFIWRKQTSISRRVDGLEAAIARTATRRKATDPPQGLRP